MDFEKPDYLLSGTEKQQKIYQYLTDHDVLGKLSRFDPVVVGTIPLNIDIGTSDVDIICQWSDPREFGQSLMNHFSGMTDFSFREKLIRNVPTVIANFRIDQIPFEIFGQNKPVNAQDAYRHMMIEHAVLQERGEGFRQEVIALKKKGLNTELAFAKLLGLPCIDPFLEILQYRQP
jgi:hypothetical protein